MSQPQTYVEKNLPAAIDRLEADTRPQWGKMSAQHMVEHLALLFYLSSGKKEAPLLVPEDRLERSMAWLMSDKDFRQNTVGPGLPAEPGPLRYPDLETAKAKMRENFHAYRTYFAENPGAKINHPAFGQLNAEQWAQFHYKHTRHHLRQFGLIED